MLRAVGVGFGYDGPDDALRSADLDVAEGEVIGVLGPNGAGKSTLLRLLDGQLAPDRGELQRSPDRLLDGRLQFGYLGESSAHFEELSGRVNATFFARAAGLDRASAADAVRGLVERLLLSGQEHRPVSSYSFGMRRKLALVEALAHRPRVVLLDEPTVGLDDDARHALADLLRDRAAIGAAIVLASHDTAFIEEVADRVVFMVDGRTKAGGRPDDLVSELGGRTTVIVTLREPSETLPPLPPNGGWKVVRTGNPLVFRMERGQDLLPELCAVLVANGAPIEEISVRAPGLSEVFRILTGAELPRAEHRRV